MYDRNTAISDKNLQNFDLLLQAPFSLWLWMGEQVGEQVGGREGQVGEKRVIWVKSDERGG